MWVVVDPDQKRNDAQLLIRVERFGTALFRQMNDWDMGNSADPITIVHED